MLRTAVQRANEILPALTHCFFVCNVDETLVCINGINCSARHAFCCFHYFRDRTYSYDEYVCIVVPGMYVIVLYMRVSYVLYVVAGCGRSYVRSVARVVW